MAIDWNRSMRQTFEYYAVNPNTWGDDRLIENVTGCQIIRNLEYSTLECATIDVDEDLGETYVREYIKVEQGGETAKIPLGTHLVQTPIYRFNGKHAYNTLDAYSPLLELKDDMPPIGYSIPRGRRILETAAAIIRDRSRLQIAEDDTDMIMPYAFTAEIDDTWLSFLTSYVSNAGRRLNIDERGKLSFARDLSPAEMVPVWRYADDNASILYPDMSDERDLYGIPNAYTAIYSLPNGENITARAENRDRNSPVSIPSRGRTVEYRDTDPDFPGIPSKEQLIAYCYKKLHEMSALEHTVTYSHGYCPVRVGDCVELNYTRAGIVGVKAKVTSQRITCKTGCEVTETATYSTDLWEE